MPVMPSSLCQTYNWMQVKAHADHDRAPKARSMVCPQHQGLETPALMRNSATTKTHS